jgi:hypothetical protein
MKQRAVSYLFCLIATLVATAFDALMPEAYTRIGLLAGLATGFVFGVSVPVEVGAASRLIRAIRSALAFAATVGIGYTVYLGLATGIAWGVGGLIGCITGCLYGQMGRPLFVSETSVSE